MIRLRAMEMVPKLMTPRHAARGLDPPGDMLEPMKQLIVEIEARKAATNGLQSGDHRPGQQTQPTKKTWQPPNPAFPGRDEIVALAMISDMLAAEEVVDELEILPSSR